MTDSDPRPIALITGAAGNLGRSPGAAPKSKAAAEAVIRAEHKRTPYVILRLAGVYDEHSTVPTMAQQMARIYERDFESYFYSGSTLVGHLSCADPASVGVPERTRPRGRVAGRRTGGALCRLADGAAPARATVARAHAEGAAGRIGANDRAGPQAVDPGCPDAGARLAVARTHLRGATHRSGRHRTVPTTDRTDTGGTP